MSYNGVWHLGTLRVNVLEICYLDLLLTPLTLYPVGSSRAHSHHVFPSPVFFFHLNCSLLIISPQLTKFFDLFSRSEACILRLKSNPAPCLFLNEAPIGSLLSKESRIQMSYLDQTAKCTLGRH